MLAADERGDVPARQARHHHVVLALHIVAVRDVVSLPVLVLERRRRLTFEARVLADDEAVHVREQERIRGAFQHAVPLHLLARALHELARHHVLQLRPPVDSLLFGNVLRLDLPRLFEPQLVRALPRIHADDDARIRTAESLVSELQPCRAVLHLGRLHDEVAPLDLRHQSSPLSTNFSCVLLTRMFVR